jgi:hypothetical protein
MRAIDALSSPSFRVYSRGIWLGSPGPFHSDDESAGWVPHVGVRADLCWSPVLSHRSRSTATCGTQFSLA